MPLFIMSMNWTEQGIRTIKDWPKRMGDTHAFAKKVGVEVKEVYLTAGEYDLIAIVDAANDDNIAKFALGLGVNGNVRTKTARAWSEVRVAQDGVRAAVAPLGARHRCIDFSYRQISSSKTPSWVSSRFTVVRALTHPHFS